MCYNNKKNNKTICGTLASKAISKTELVESVTEDPEQITPDNMSIQVEPLDDVVDPQLKHRHKWITEILCLCRLLLFSHIVYIYSENQYFLRVVEGRYLVNYCR